MPSELTKAGQLPGRDLRTLPLATWADRQLAELARTAAAPALAGVSGKALLGERAALNGFCVPARVSAGGGCRLFAASDGDVALNLARPEDRELLPALFGDTDVACGDDADIAIRLLRSETATILDRGRKLGLAIAARDEPAPGPALTTTALGLPTVRQDRVPLVIDLSALWAGPLAAHLLAVAGAQVVKVESQHRPDAMREGDPALFARINGGKHSVLVDFRRCEGRNALLALLRRADIVVEAARPRALLQLGIDADALVRETPGLVWVTVTGHGVQGAAAQWIGFGDDCGVAGGLTAALFRVTGKVGFVGDAIADPLTGIAAARAALQQRRRGMGARLIVSMAGVAATALADEVHRDAGALAATLTAWARSSGRPCPAVPLRKPVGPMRPLGADTSTWLAPVAAC